MAIHSSILAWKIPWTGELGGLQLIGSQRVPRRHWAHTHTVDEPVSKLHVELVLKLCFLGGL